MSAAGRPSGRIRLMPLAMRLTSRGIALAAALALGSV
jgi:hypothetical protein